MEDDGLLINFKSSGDAKPAPVKASGRWKDRRKSLKQARKQGGVADGRVAKATRSEPKVQIKKPAVKKVSKPIVGPTKQVSTNPQDKDTFLSSLFTSNPEITGEASSKEAGEVTNAPMRDEIFPDLGVPPSMCNLLSKMNVERPTRIQRQAIPVLAQEKDALVIAQTGSGKTLAYLLPIISRLMKQPDLHRESGIFAVILAPTRELATQIYQVLEELVRCCHWLVPGIVIGGEKRKSEKARLRKGVNVLVGTPGRLADHFDNTRSLDLAEVRWVVLDEGDRLVELGFEETLTKIIEQIAAASQLSQSRYRALPSTRTHVLCSATMTSSIERLKTMTLRDPIWIKEEQAEAGEFAPAQLQQSVAVVPAKLRLVTLAAALKRKASKSGKAIVFFSCSDSVDFHYAALTSDDNEEIDLDKDEDDNPQTAAKRPLGAGGKRIGRQTAVFKLHGSLSQSQRAATLSAFSASKNFAVLLCTDVASRGIDVQVDYVVEYDPPFAVEDHIHRVGRTARAGRSGSALLFVLPGSEEKYATEKIAAVHPAGVSYETYQQLLEHSFGRRWENDATTWHLNVERWILRDESAHEMAKRAFMSHVGAYATHVSAERVYFGIKNLHLGHISKAFGLRETPGKVSSQNASGPRPKKPKMSTERAMMQAAAKHSNMSDYNIM